MTANMCMMKYDNISLYYTPRQRRVGCNSFGIVLPSFCMYVSLSQLNGQAYGAEFRRGG